MLPFPHWVPCRERGGIDQSGIRPEGRGDGLKALQRGLSQNVEQKRGWVDEEVEENGGK